MARHAQLPSRTEKKERKAVFSTKMWAHFGLKIAATLNVDHNFLQQFVLRKRAEQQRAAHLQRLGTWHGVSPLQKPTETVTPEAAVVKDRTHAVLANC